MLKNTDKKKRRIWTLSMQSFEHATAEVNNGGSLLNKPNYVSYESRKNLLIYKLEQLESTFV